MNTFTKNSEIGGGDVVFAQLKDLPITSQIVTKTAFDILSNALSNYVQTSADLVTPDMLSAALSDQLNCVDEISGAVFELSGQTVITTERFDETISSITSALNNTPTAEYINDAIASAMNNVPTVEYVDAAVSSALSNVVSIEFFNETVSQLMSVINDLSAKLQAVIDHDTPPPPEHETELSDTFSWTDEDGEHTEYLSSLNSFAWKDDDGAHYYCVDHGADNPECPEYQAVISSETSNQAQQQSSDENGSPGTFTMVWTDETGSHSMDI